MDVRRDHHQEFGASWPGLNAEEWAWLVARWRTEHLAGGQVLCDTDCLGEAVWLLDDAVVARVAHDRRGHAFEIGVDGRGSVACAWTLDQSRRSPWRTEVRRPGMARALPRADAELLARFAPAFHARCRSIVHAEVLELAEQFAVSRRRTARSLLAERLAAYFAAFEENAIAVTHSTLARRLNLRRATVTLALQELEGMRAIRSHRARIELKDADRLNAIAQEV